MLNVNRNFAALNFSILTKLGMEILMSPLHFFKSFDKDRSALNVFASWLTPDGVSVIRQRSAHEFSLDTWVPVLICCLLCHLDGLEHDESVVETFEKRSNKN